VAAQQCGVLWGKDSRCQRAPRSMSASSTIAGSRRRRAAREEPDRVEENGPAGPIGRVDLEAVLHAWLKSSAPWPGCGVHGAVPASRSRTRRGRHRVAIVQRVAENERLRARRPSCVPPVIERRPRLVQPPAPATPEITALHPRRTRVVEFGMKRTARSTGIVQGVVSDEHRHAAACQRRHRAARSA